MKYPQITEWSLMRYREDSKSRRGSVTDETRDAIDRLIKTIEAAIDHAATLRPREVR